MPELNKIDTNQSMTDFIKEACIDNQIKIKYLGKKINTEKFFCLVNKVSAYLQNKGFKKGDVAVICLPNIPQAVIALYAINQIGGIADIVHPKMGTKGLSKIIDESNAKFIFLFDLFLKQHYKGLKNKDITIISCGVSTYANNYISLIKPYEYILGIKKKVVNFTYILKKEQFEKVNINCEDNAIYMHSSGTTGESKTVAISSKAWNELAKNIYISTDPYIHFTPTDNMHMILPLFHGFGLGVCVHLALFFGAINMQPTFKAIDIVKILKKNKDKIILSLVPNLLRKLIQTKGFEGPHLKYVDKIFIGGDKLDDSLWDEAQEIFKRNGSKCTIHEGFGLSETCSVTHINLECKRGGTVGKPINNVKCKILDDDLNELKPFEEGNVYICSPSLMNGYVGEFPLKILTDTNGDKWLDTGDRGYMDDEGFFFYKGRLKRMTKIGGVNIYPQEVEGIALKNKYVDNCCAIRTKQNGKPIIKLIVQTKDNILITKAIKEDIIKTIRSELLPYAVPRVIEQVDMLRLNATGKTDYKYYEDQEGEK